MFKIGEFSRLGQVSTRMLRHYDKLGLLTPSHTDPWTGYRYYTIDQLARLHRIIALKELGLTLQQITDLLDGGDELPTEQLRGMLLMRRKALEQSLREGELRLRQVEARLQHIEQAGEPSPYEVVVKALEPVRVASIRQTVPTIGEMGYYCDTLYRQLYARLRAWSIRPIEPEVTLYHTEEYVETDLEVEIAVAVDASSPVRDDGEGAVGFRDLPSVDRAAALLYEGPLAEVEPAILALLAWVGSNRHTPAGPLREIHLTDLGHDGGEEVEPSIVEFQLPIAPLDVR